MTNRYVCDVLREMRTCSKTKNYSYLESLIEEVQVMVNRMEAGLYDKADHLRETKYYKEKKKERKKIEAAIEVLTEEKEELETNIKFLKKESALNDKDQSDK